MDLMLPLVCTVTDHGRLQNQVRTSVTSLAAPGVLPFFFLTAFWYHMWSITEQMHSNAESVCWADNNYKSQ